MHQGLTESHVIDALRRAFPHDADLHNDAAMHHATSHEIIVCSDNCIEGIHFHNTDSPKTVVKRFMCRVFSDLAASGAYPTAISLNFMLGSRITLSYITEMIAHIKDICESDNIRLLGGDTSLLPGETSAFSITALGHTDHRLRRDLAIDGQLLFVTGTIGDSYLAFMIKSGKLTAPTSAIREYFYAHDESPNARVSCMQTLCPHIDCAIDISDGLLQDAHNLGLSSNKHTVIHISDIPLSVQACAVLQACDSDTRQELLIKMLTWGDDYEVLFTAYPETLLPIKKVQEIHSLPVTCIGYVGIKKDKNSCVTLIASDGSDITPSVLGYAHKRIMRK
ncbi:MAG: thiamine-monophosphate kinase [Alphaproteobacteria bacterium]|nr:MAG: thiamine-monophosphate kinase [Alphaproteobacteria bacterium]